MSVKISFTGVKMSIKVVIPDQYKSSLSLMETEVAIKKVKDFFEVELAGALNLTRVSAPLFVRPETGLNDNLNNIERPVSFDAKGITGNLEIVHSLAKWKRDALHRYEFSVGEGLYTDMNAIRRDEDLSNIHSFYVDQIDWEKVIVREERTQEFLRETVRVIYSVLQRTQEYIYSLYPILIPSEDTQWGILPEHIFFVSTQELEDRFPELSPKEREHAITKVYGAVFVTQVGGNLKSGEIHDGRSAEYDSWTLNGDILVWNTVLQESLELSSMGIRVDADELISQCREKGIEDKLSLPYHQGVLNNTLPLTIGGGIGQSRICLFLLKKCHIGEAQSSVWDKETIQVCQERGVQLL